MRFISTKATSPYIDQMDREPYTADDAPSPDLVGKPNPDGAALPGATTFHFRGLTSAEEGALTDNMFTTSVTGADTGKDAKVNMAMNVSPSKNRRERVQLALTGWDNFWVDNPNADSDPSSGPAVIDLPYTTSSLTIGGATFQGAANEAMDLIPQEVLLRMEKHVKSLSSVEPGAGKP